MNDQGGAASTIQDGLESDPQSQHGFSTGPIERRASVPPADHPSGNNDQLHAEIRHDLVAESSSSHPAAAAAAAAASEWSHQQLAPQPQHDGNSAQEEEGWQDMPAYAPFDIYDDDGKLIAREAAHLDEEAAAYGHLGGAGKGYTRVQADEDAKSVTSMDDNTAYLFKEHGTNVADEDDEEARDPLSQMQTTKGLLTEGQRIAYVGMIRLAMVEMHKEIDALERTKGARKAIDLVLEAFKMWSQKMMVRLYSHMDIDAAGRAVDTRHSHNMLMLTRNRTDNDRATSGTRRTAWGPHPGVDAELAREESSSRRIRPKLTFKTITTPGFLCGNPRKQNRCFGFGASPK